MARALGFALLVVSAVAGAAVELEVRNLSDLRRRLGVDAYDSVPGHSERLKALKVAIIDKGFGDPAVLERFLPPTVFTFVPTYEKEFIEKHGLGNPESQVPLDAQDDHGRLMALALWAATGYREDSAPQVYLLNGNGFTNLSRAVRFCKENGVRIILYSQNWEYGGNFDGRGFINKVVTEATSAGILWVNAAGNYRGKVYNGSVTKAEGGSWIRFSNGSTSLRLTNNLDRNPIRIVLSWNRYGEEESSGTDLDLDLYVYDEFRQEIFKADLKQVVGREGVARGEGESYVPREIVEGTFARNRAGSYHIQVLHKSGTLSPADRLRVTVVPSKPVDFPDASAGGEIMIPADHPQVVTVGDKSDISSRGPTADGRIKPDLLLERSDIEFTDGEGAAGTSNAAALFAGVLAVLKAERPHLDRAGVINLAREMAGDVPQRTGEESGIVDIGLPTFERLHRPIYYTLTQILLGQPLLLAGRLPSGTFLVALDRSPLELKGFYSHLPKDRRQEDVEIWLTSRLGPGNRPQVYAYWRPVNRQSWREQTWERELKAYPDRFVRVVQARFYPRQQVLAEPPVWRTPRPEVFRYTAP